MELWSGPSPGNFPGKWCKTRVGRAYMGKTHRLLHEALLLVSKTSNSQNPRKLPGPGADGAYRLTLGLTSDHIWSLRKVCEFTPSSVDHNCGFWSMGWYSSLC